jgi:nucleotide-binding universal stress UspA family protein
MIELLEEEGCEAVVMGSHGMGLVRSALGSVSRGMLEDAPVPVTFVKAAPEPEVEEEGDEDMAADAD